MKIAAALLAITALSFFVFPGHTYLQQDTQIYVPILENQWSGALAQDLIVQHPHVNFTLYDELTNSVRWLTRASLEHVLQAEQIAFRLCGFVGVYLTALAFRLRVRDALVVTAIFGLGASIAAPAVLTMEFEPTPRAFAAPLVFLSVGLLLHGRDWLSGAAGAAAILLHAPTAWPLCVVVAAVAAVRRRSALAFVPMIAASIAIFWIGRWQSVAEPQNLLAHLDAQQESLQRMRAAYVYVSTWWEAWVGQYLLFAAAAVLGLWRLRASVEVRTAVIAFVATGLVSVPLSWLLLEHWNFSAAPQIQLARALLFVTAMTIIAGSAAGCSTKRWESFGWFVFALFAAVEANVFARPGMRAALMIIVCATALSWSRSRIAAAALLAPAMLWAAHIVTHRNIETPELAALAEWARNNTRSSSVFVFPDAGRDRSPGWFRARALRAVFVDWKGGGQVNYLRDFGEEWSRRWETVNRGVLPEGINFEVVRRPIAGKGLPAYSNSSFVVYRVARAI